MLVEKTAVPNTIIAIKLVTGEEIIALKLGDDDHHLTVSRPVSMVMTENPDNPQQTRVVFAPWMVAAGKDIVTIKSQHIIAISIAREDAATQYEEAIK